MALTIRSLERDDVVIFELEGSLDITSATDLDKQFNAQVGNYKKFAFDLEKVDFIDSSGIGELVKIYSTCKRTQYEVFVFAAQDSVQSALEAGHVDRFLQVMTRREFGRKCPAVSEIGDLIRRL